MVIIDYAYKTQSNLTYFQKLPNFVQYQDEINCHDPEELDAIRMLVL
jgi:hypothetical protein